ncbi:DNRLRE domain-containing protein [Algibacter sp. 2305UL17-15]|uniref:CBM96 family carbohydrate-binding protein n=1 Tax=Algibacter sp. 2305UL17-15 TaxID=3231268 RepID=UPI00345B0EB8
MKNYYAFFMLLISSFTYGQNTYYVDQQTGDDSNNGTSLASAYETIEAAVGNLQAGDTMYIVGEYHNPSYNPNYSYSGNINDSHIWHAENTVKINNLNGTASQYITISGYNNATVLKGDGANILRITNSSYLIIKDFEIEGEVDNIPLSTALSLQFLYRIGSSTSTQHRVPPGTTTAQVEALYSQEGSLPKLNNSKRPSYTDTRGLYFSKVHHIDILNNTVHHTPGNGFRVSDGDYLNITGNEVYSTSRKSYSGTHGMVITNSLSFDTSNATKIFITKNKVHNNYNEIYSWAPTKTFITPRIDEGKGISLQRNDIDDNGTPNDPNDDTGWLNGRILVANNLTYWNGFSGVHSNTGLRIDFVNNTCFMNSYTNTVTYANEVQQGRNIGASAQGGADNKFINNVIYIDNAWEGYPISIANESNVEVRDNLVFGINGSVTEDLDVTAIAVNTTIADPLFNNTAQLDFGLQTGSPAIDIANTGFAPTDDFFGNLRDSNPDLGAIENMDSVPTLPEAPTNAAAVETSCTSIAITWDDNSDNEDGFKIMRGINGSNHTLYETTAPDVTSFNAENLDENTTYSFRVKAFNVVGNTSASQANVIVTSSCGVNSVDATNDAYVRNGNKSGNNYGSNSVMQIKETSKSNKKRHAYIQFDVSDLTTTQGNIVLRIQNDGNNGSVKVHELSNDSWDENTITWNNKPSSTGLIGTLTLNNNATNEIDVTSYVVNQVNGDGVASFVLKGNNSTLYKIATKEGSFAPELAVAGTTSKRSNGKQIAASSNVTSVKIYPNPATDRITVNFVASKTNALNTVRVYNSIGQLLIHKTTNESLLTIPLNIKSGIYFMEVESQGNRTIKKIVKQ